MTFPPHVPAQIQDFVDGVRAALSGFFRTVAEKAAELRDRAQPVVDRLMNGVFRRAEFPPGIGRLRWSRSRILIVSLGGAAILVLIISGASLLAKDKSEAPKPAVVRQGHIPPDELFLPDEPDFVPGILLEREQRAVWTAGDAEPLWQDPLENGEEPWRARIEQTIDEIMESVP